MNDEARLQEILETNPFLTVIDSWRMRLETLQDAPLSVIQKDENAFLLKSDLENDAIREELFSCARRKQNAIRLRLDVVPQPFIGNPHADVWLLGMNPSFSMPDYYDLVSINEQLKTDICSSLVDEVPNCNAADFCFTIRDKQEERLFAEKRRDLLLSQFDLRSIGNMFYPLADCFKTFANRASGSLLGTRGWWDGTLNPKNACSLFGNDEKSSTDFGARLFVLEAFPYHSRRFGGFPKSYISHGGSEYLRFVREMLAYAKSSGKKIVSRGKGDKYLEVLGLTKSDVFLPRNWQRVLLTYGNYPSFPK